MKKINTYWLALILLGLLPSCIDDSYDLDEFSSESELNTALVGPVGRSNISLTDLLQKLSIDIGAIGESEDGNQLITFFYDSTFVVKVDPLKMKFSEFEETFEGPGDPRLQELINNDEMSFQEDFSFGLNDNSDESEDGERIDSVLLKDAYLHLNVEASGFGDVDLIFNLIFPSKVRNPDGIQPAPPVPVHLGENTINLSGYFLNFTPVGEDLKFTFETTVPADQGISLGDASLIHVSGKMDDDLTFERAWGKFARQYEGDPIAIDLFGEMNNESIKLLFVDPKFNIYPKTNVILPASFHIDGLTAINSKDGETKKLVFKNDTPEEYTLRPSDNESEFKETSPIILNKDNTTIAELLKIYPDSLKFSYSFVVDKTIEGKSISDLSTIELTTHVELPAWFDPTSHVTLEDTIKNINLGDFVDRDFELILLLSLTNNLPLNVDLKLSFLDESYKRIDIKINNNDNKIEIAPAKVDANKYAISPNAPQEKRVTLDKSIPTEDLKRIKHLKLEYEIAVKGNEVKVSKKDILQADVKFFLKGGLKL